MNSSRHTSVLQNKLYKDLRIVSLENAIETLTTIVLHIEAKAQIAKEYLPATLTGLTNDEASSLCLYSMQWEPPEQSLYHQLNIALREQDQNKLKPWFPFLKLFTKALDGLPSEPLTVYRGIKGDVRGEYKKDTVFTWPSFTSCSKSLDILQSEQFLGKEDKRTMFIIKCFNGKDLSKYSYYRSENEILLNMETQFRVVSYLDQGNDFYIIELEELFSKVNILYSHKIFQNQENKIERIIANSKSQTHIYIVGRHLTTECCEIIANQVLINRQCIHLSIRECQISSQGIIILANTLSNNETLTYLALFNNHITDSDVQILSQALSGNTKTKLECLNLTKNQITDLGAQFLSEMLKTNKEIKKLWLQFNPISEIGVQAIVNTLKTSNQTLQTLSIDWKKLNARRNINALVEMLRRNQTLKELNTSSRRLSKTNRKNLREIEKLKENFKLNL